VLPNLFGEHGRPGYNSVVATFCHAIANGQDVELRDDKDLSLLGVRDASAQLLPDATSEEPPAATVIAVSGVLRLLREFEATYRDGQIPRLDTRFRTQLFNTYRSFTFPARFPIPLVRREDDRGALVETIRSHGGTGQAFISSTKPGVTRGQHFHLDKIERFVVFEGQARISLRRLFHTDVVSFLVSGDEPAIVDMPTLWTHNVTNLGSSTLYTQFWADQLFDPAAPDTFYEDV
jgi:UDP-2-acetamido-2,6-beta-L-arabino-hexul-4-ose reductase